MKNKLLLLGILSILQCQLVAAQLTLFSPAKDELLVEGQPYTIRWKAGAGIAKVYINLEAPSGMTYGIAYNIDASAGQFVWRLPYHLPDSGKIYISAMSDPAVRDGMKNNFPIQQIPELKLFAPDEKAVFVEGEKAVIKWRARPGIHKVWIAFEGLKYYHFVGEADAATGQYIWLLPYDLPDSGRLVIRAVSPANESLADTSAVPFVIEQRTQYKVVAPVENKALL